MSIEGHRTRHIHTCVLKWAHGFIFTMLFTKCFDIWQKSKLSNRNLSNVMDVQVYRCYLTCMALPGVTIDWWPNQAQKDAPPWPNPIEMYEVSARGVWQLSGQHLTIVRYVSEIMWSLNVKYQHFHRVHAKAGPIPNMCTMPIYFAFNHFAALGAISFIYMYIYIYVYTQ